MKSVIKMKFTQSRLKLIVRDVRGMFTVGSNNALEGLWTTSHNYFNCVGSHKAQHKGRATWNPYSPTRKVLKSRWILKQWLVSQFQLGSGMYYITSCLVCQTEEGRLTSGIGVLKPPSAVFTRYKHIPGETELWKLEFERGYLIWDRLPF